MSQTKSPRQKPGAKKKTQANQFSPHDHHWASDGPATLSSRYKVASEEKVLAQMLNALTPDLRRCVQSIRCDSKAGHVWVAELHFRDEISAKKIAMAMEFEALKAFRGHNGVIVNDGGHQEVMPGFWAHRPE